jgi:hypothetical protein
MLNQTPPTRFYIVCMLTLTPHTFFFRQNHILKGFCFKIWNLTSFLCVCDKETKEVFFFIKSGSTTALICVIIIIRQVLDFNNSGGRYTCTKVVWKEYRICIFIQFLIVCEIKSKERIQQVSNYKILTFLLFIKFLRKITHLMSYFLT